MVFNTESASPQVVQDRRGRGVECHDRGRCELAEDPGKHRVAAHDLLILPRSVDVSMRAKNLLMEADNRESQVGA